MNWEELQAAIATARAAGDTEKIESLLMEYATGANTRIEGLNGEAAKNRHKANDNAAMLAKFDGIDVVDFERLKTAAAAQEQDKLKAAGKFDEIVVNMNKSFDERLAAANTNGADWKTKFEGLAVDKVLVDAAAKHNGIDPAEIAQLTRGRIKLGDNGVPVVLKVNGDPDFDKAGNAQTIEGFIGGWLQDRPHHVKGTPGGSGSHNNSDRGSGGKTNINAGEIGDNLEAVAKGDAVVNTQ